VNIENTVSEDASIFGGEDVISAGWGLWLVVVGSVILGVAALDLARRASTKSKV
jgi:hypothetical protein